MEKYEELRWFLIRKFIVILAIVGIVEYGLLTLINEVAMPVVFPYFFPGAAAGTSLSALQVAAMFVLVLISIVIWGIRGLLPTQASSALQWMGEAVDRLTGNVAPAVRGDGGMTHLDGGRRILFFLYLFVAVFLLLLPFVLGAFVYARIVTREFTKIQDVREAAKREFDRKRNLMLSDIAHDLRTPITTVAGYATALSDGMIPPDKQQEYLDAIRNKSARMNDLISLLFDYVKLDSEGFALDMVELDLCELLRENAALIYSDIENAGMELDIEIPEERIPVQADRLQLSRVVTNLLVNAIRHNGPQTRICLQMLELEEQICVAVADSGACIEDDIAAHLFEPFYKGDRSRTGAGSGLGLSIARKVVRMHGWELALVQQPSIQRIPGLERFAKAFVIRIPLS